MGILVDKSCRVKILDRKYDFKGRILSLKCSFHDQLFTLLNIYAPNVPSQRRLFFDCLHEYIFPGTKLIIGGDFNCILSDRDKQDGNIIGLDWIEKTSRIDLSLSDIWRSKHPYDIVFSWHNFDFSI